MAKAATTFRFFLRLLRVSSGSKYARKYLILQEECSLQTSLILLNALLAEFVQACDWDKSEPFY